MATRAVEFRGLRVFADPDATRGKYLTVDADSCWRTCAYCRNMRPQLPDILGHEMRNLLRQLGVDPLKPSEAVHYGRQEDGGHLYCVVYHFAGQLDPSKPMREIAAPRGGRDFLTDSVDVPDKRSLHFSSAYFPHNKVFDGSGHLHAEIYIDGVKWVIKPLAES
jgi:hypothetical protein